MTITLWTTVLRQHLLNRSSPVEIVKFLQQRAEINGKAILNALLDCRQSFCAATDPLPPRYFESFLTSRLISVPDMLVVLVSKWNTASRLSKPVQFTNTAIRSLQELALLLASKLAVNRSDTLKCLLLSSRWLTVLVRSFPQSSDSTNSTIAEAVGSLLATLSGTESGIEILSEKRDGSKHMSKVVESVRHAVELATGAFPSLSVQLIERLSAIQKHIAMFSDPQAEQTTMQALNVQATVPQMQMAASRAGTVLYLDAMICTARTIDDTIVFNFLAGRHNNDWALMFQDILLASFHVLKSSHDGPRKALRFHQAKLFVQNKLPSTLATISGSSFGIVSPEQAVASAWEQVKTDLSSPELLACGHHFLHTCSLHHLITPEAAHQLIADQDLISGLPKGMYSKDDLIVQVNANHSRMSKLVEELTRADGSAAAISQAIVETAMSYCQNKDTHSLKDLANAILRQPESINSLAMFVRPSYWLGSLCALLDEWRWDDIHGESQPVYEEFGSILLLVIASKRRLHLSISDIGMQEGFVARYLDQEGTESPTLSEDSQKHLGDWIYAMYVAEVLSDDVTTTCSAQEFYLLVPNLLRQSLLALEKEKLSLEGLKGGLEYLLEPFLLPSVVSAITWTTKNARASAFMDPVFNKSTGNAIQQTILAMTSNAWSFELERGENFEQEAAAFIAGKTGALPSSLLSHLQGKGPELALRCILRTLQNGFAVALDVMATLVCVADREIRDLLRVKFMTLKDPLTAEVIVHLHRRVEAYASVLIVQDIGIEFVQLNNIDTTDANLDATQEQPVDDIDQVLNETAAMGNSMEQPELSGDVTMDDFYGMHGDNMGLGNLDDLDLEMF